MVNLIFIVIKVYFGVSWGFRLAFLGVHCNISCFKGFSWICCVKHMGATYKVLGFCYKEVVDRMEPQLLLLLLLLLLIWGLPNNHDVGFIKHVSSLPHKLGLPPMLRHT